MKRFTSLWIVCLCLVFPFATLAGPNEATTKLIKDLGLRQSEKPVRDSSHWRKPRRIVITMLDRQLKSRPDAIQWLREVAGDAEIVVANTRNVSPELLQGADILLGYCNHANLKHGKQLRYIFNYSAGVDKCISSPLLQDRPILVTNMQRIYGPGIAEHVIGLMYMLTRKLHVYHDRQQSSEWDRGAVERTDMWEVQDRTMLVVGLGGIGTQVAMRANALGMRVIAIRNSSRRGPEYMDYVGLPDELHKLARQADVVVNTAPFSYT